MGVQNKFRTWAFVATADLNSIVSGAGHIYKAVSQTNGDIASDGIAATGILQQAADDAGHINQGYDGIQKYTAGAAISTADTFLTVTTSGYFIAATSGTAIVGRTLTVAVSGGVHTGMFNFPKPSKFDSSSGHISTYETMPVSAQADLSASAGLVVDMVTGDVAATSDKGDGIIYTGTVSGGVSQMRVMGKMTAYARGAITIQKSLKVDTGGYVNVGNSGDLLVGKALATVASGQSFLGMFNFATPHYATSCLDVQY